MKRTSTAFSIRKANWGSKDIFPDFIYLDTNAVLDIMEGRTYGTITEEYLNELASRDGMITWSNHLMDELHDYYHYQIYVEEADKLSPPKNNTVQPYKWLENTASDQQSAGFAKQVVQKVKQTKQYLEQFGIQFDPDTEEVNQLATHLYSNYGTNNKDSKHVAIATLAGTNNILTQDSGFLRFPHVNVLGASKEIVSNKNSVINDTSSFVDLRDLFSENKNEDENVS